MAISANHVMSVILILALLITVSLDLTVGQIGVAYGTNGVNIIPPAQVVELFNNYGIQRMRIYERYPEILPAVEGSNIELTISIQNRDLGGIAADQANADAWVLENISKYPNINFRHIVVGNEVSPANPDTNEYVPFVLPALQNVYKAISTVGLAGIQVTTAIDTRVLDNAYPPDEGVFRADVTDYLNPIIGFLLDTDAPLFANIYPYFAYLEKPDVIPLPYALLDPNFEGVTMPNGVVYKNLFYALVDAVYAALEKSAAAASDATTDQARTRNIRSMVVKGGESGWPSGGGHGKRLAGDLDDVSNPDTAGTYVNNLIQAVKYGTPMRPDQPIETYIFAMFDEDLKQGDETEKHFGLFTPDGQPKYQLSFN